MARWRAGWGTTLALVIVTLGVGGLASVARAQGSEAAEQALARGDVDRARRLATDALESGAQSAETLAPLYRVLAVALARAGDEDGARRAFTRLLALDPEFRLARTEPDEIRSPYMEARGFWSTVPDRLSAEVRIADDRDGLVVRVSDPAALAARVRLRVRVGGAAGVVDVARAPEETLAIPMAGLESSRGIEYQIGFLDEHGNRLWQRGSDEAWERLEAAAPATSRGATPTSPEVADATPFHIGATSMLIVAVGAGVGGAIAHLEREHLAEVWNSESATDPRCTGGGSTLAEVCADERDAISTTEIVAGVLYGTAGAALITAGLLLFAAPSPGESESLAWWCGPGPGAVGVQCSHEF